MSASQATGCLLHKNRLDLTHWKAAGGRLLGYLDAASIRMIADSSIAVCSLAFGLALTLLLKLYARQQQTEVVFDEFIVYFRSYAAWIAVLSVAMIGLLGLYSRARYYAPAAKCARLVHAISLAYIGLVFIVYWMGFTGGYIPRGAFATAYLCNLAGAVGIRLAKDYFDRNFVVKPKKRNGNGEVRHVLVVGGAGYIGSGLVRDLLAEGYRVRVLDSLIYGDSPVRDLLGHGNFEMVRGDFRHVGDVVRAVQGVDAVIHLGAIVGDPACAVNENETLATNLAATHLLAQVSKASGVSRLLFASTCSVYGAAGETVDEKSWLNPVSLYAATKIDSEQVLLASRDRDFHPVVLRLATAFGWSHRPRFDLVVNLLAAKAVADKRIIIYNGEQWRPFIHVRDISRAFRMALRAPVNVVSGQIFNTGSNRMNCTLQRLAEMIAVHEPGLEVEYLHNSDARSYRVNFDKIRAELGFDTEVTLADGILETRNAIVSGAVADYRDSTYSNVQLVRRMHSDGRLSRGAEAEISLTALQFTKNGHWLRAVLER